MPQFSPDEAATKLGSGLLSFPVTHFRSDLSFDEAAYRENIGRLGAFSPAGLFAAGGTGEFFSLTQGEIARVVAATVTEAPAGLPVVAPAGGGTATAVELARQAENDGADAILLLPPYLTEASQEGLAAHVKAVCRATRLGVIVYSRANAVYDDSTVAELADSCPQPHRLQGRRRRPGADDADPRPARRPSRLRRRTAHRRDVRGALSGESASAPTRPPSSTSCRSSPSTSTKRCARTTAPGSAGA